MKILDIKELQQRYHKDVICMIVISCKSITINYTNQTVLLFSIDHVVSFDRNSV